MPTATATLGGTTLATTDTYETVEGNIYFPRSAISDASIFHESKTTSKCPWKGTASHYDVVVNGKTFKDAAWYYPQPKEKAENIRDAVAFYKSKIDVKTS